MAWNRHAIAQTQLRGRRRVDGVGRPKLDFHTGPRASIRKSKTTEDDDEGLGLCRLFCEMGEAYLPMIASEARLQPSVHCGSADGLYGVPVAESRKSPFGSGTTSRKPSRRRRTRPCNRSFVQLCLLRMSGLARLCVRLSARTENDLDGEDKDADSPTSTRAIGRTCSRRWATAAASSGIKRCWRPSRRS